MTKSIKIVTFSIIGLIGLLLESCNEEEPSTIISASANLTNIQLNIDDTYIVSTESRGKVSLSMEDSVVTMTIALTNFPPNSVHAVHIHEGTCEDPAKHWNVGVPHTEKFCNTRSLGLPWAKPMGGDVGNVSVGYDGSGSLTIKTDLWRIGSGNSLDVLGKSVIIHEKYQDFTEECDPFHDHVHSHANAKVACGIIL